MNDDGSHDEEKQETIGSFRLNREILADAAKNGKLLKLSDGGVEVLELEVSPASGTALRRNVQTLEAKSQLARIPSLDVLAGEVVEVRASGIYHQSSHKVGPEGLPLAGLETRRLAGSGFQSVPFGAAIALIGKKSFFEPLPVLRCAAMVSLYDGQVTVGINDRTPQNAIGALDFEVSVRNPTPEEWKEGKARDACANVRTDASSSNKWVRETVRKVIALMAGKQGSNIATNIQRITHPSGNSPILGQVKVANNEGTIVVRIPVAWRGGILGGLYTTIVMWDFNQKRHGSATVLQDNSPTAVASKNAQQLDGFFRDNLYPAVSGKK